MEKVDFSVMFPDNRRENRGETVLRQAQLVMLRMFKIIDYLCRKHDIKYWMCSGTLLGAVRHQGFIPWDDDLDICMIREDYERFVEVAQKEFPNDLILQTRETNPNYRNLGLPCKVRDRHSYSLSSGYLDDVEKGLFIDVFPVDRYHTGKLEFLFEKGIKSYNRVLFYCLISVHFKELSFLRRFLSYFHPLFTFLALRYMKYSKRLIQRNRNLGANSYVGHGFDTPWTRYFTYDDIFPLQELEFEGGLFYAPRNTSVYLLTLYGTSYMTPPPKSERSTAQHAHLIKPILD